MAQKGVKADVTTVSGGGDKEIQPPSDEDWIIKSAFAEHDTIELEICNGSINCEAKLILGSNDSIPIEQNNYIKLKNTGGSSSALSYHAIEIG